jgi:hypothetical protein
MRRFLLIATIIAGLLMAAFPVSSMADGAGDVYKAMGIRYGVDPNLLRALAIKESDGYPWTVDLNGEPFFLPDKESAVKLIISAQTRPWLAVVTYDDSRPTQRYLFSSKAEADEMQRELTGFASFKVRKINPLNFDVGLMGVNWTYNGSNVPSLQRLMDMDYNVAYGAYLFALLIRQHGVEDAIGYYHSSTPALQKDYKESVLRIYRRLSKADQRVAEKVDQLAVVN